MCDRFGQLGYTIILLSCVWGITDARQMWEFFVVMPAAKITAEKRLYTLLKDDLWEIAGGRHC